MRSFLICIAGELRLSCLYVCFYYYYLLGMDMDSICALKYLKEIVYLMLLLVEFPFNFLPFRFVSSVIPPGGQDLKGDEVDTIVKFKKALGIDDPEAAAMHMEVLFVSCIWHMFQFV